MECFVRSITRFCFERCLRQNGNGICSVETCQWFQSIRNRLLDSGQYTGWNSWSKLNKVLLNLKLFNSCLPFAAFAAFWRFVAANIHSLKTSALDLDVVPFSNAKLELLTHHFKSLQTRQTSVSNMMLTCHFSLLRMPLSMQLRSMPHTRSLHIPTSKLPTNRYQFYSTLATKQYQASTTFTNHTTLCTAAKKTQTQARNANSNTKSTFQSVHQQSSPLANQSNTRLFHVNTRSSIAKSLTSAYTLTNAKSASIPKPFAVRTLSQFLPRQGDNSSRLNQLKFFLGQIPRQFRFFVMLNRRKLFLLRIALVIFVICYTSIGFGSGPSMWPTFSPYFQIFVMEYFTHYWYRLKSRNYSLENYDNCNIWQKGDVVWFYAPYDCDEKKKKKVIKRIVALPGEQVTFRPVNYKMEPMAQSDRYEIVEPGHVWVQGDFLEASRDSREYGAIPMKDIQARIVFKLLPIQTAGKVERTTAYRGF